MISDTSCAQCRELLIWYASDQLAPAEHARIAHHLAGCADCRAELAQWRKVATVFTAADELPPDHEAAATWGKLLTHLPPSPHHSNNGKTTRGFSHMEFDAPNTDNPVVTPLTTRDPKAPAKRQRTLLAPVAALLLVIIGVIVFTVLRPQHTPHGVTPGATTSVSPALGTPIDTAQSLPTGIPIDAKTGLPQDMTLQKVQMVSAHDGWAVGAIVPANPAQDNTFHPPISSLILHYDGKTWKPVGVSLPQSQLDDISLLPSGDGWAVGQTYTITAGQKLPAITPVILRAVAGHWYHIRIPSSLFLTAVTSIDDNEAWAAGAMYAATATPHTTSVIAHFSNDAWSVVATFPTLDPVNAFSLALASPATGWAASGTQLVHFHGGNWTPWLTQLQGYVTNMQMLSPADGWVVGGNASQNGARPTANGFIAHFDGTAWKTVATPPENDLTTLNGIAMTATNNGWAIGDTEHEADLAPAVLLHDTNGAWSNVTTPSDGDLTSIAMVSATEGWIVGASKHHSGGHATALIWHYLNGTWRSYGG